MRKCVLVCVRTLLHTCDRYDSNTPREYMCINYALVLRTQQHIAHCHLDFLVYYSLARPSSCASWSCSTDWLVFFFSQEVRVVDCLSLKNRVKNGTCCYPEFCMLQYKSASCKRNPFNAIFFLTGALEN